MRGNLGDNARLTHIRRAISTIEKYMAISIEFNQFKPDTLLFDAVVRQLSIIGEAANHVSDALQNLNPEIPWPQIVSLRNMVMHEYFGIDAAIIWKIVHEDLPVLKEQIAMLETKNEKA